MCCGTVKFILSRNNLLKNLAYGLKKCPRYTKFYLYSSYFLILVTEATESLSNHYLIFFSLTIASFGRAISDGNFIWCTY